MKKIKKYLGKDIKMNFKSRNHIKDANIQDISTVKYSQYSLYQIREELKNFDRKTGKIHNALHPREYVNNLYVKRKKMEELTSTLLSKSFRTTECTAIEL